MRERNSSRLYIGGSSQSQGHIDEIEHSFDEATSSDADINKSDRFAEKLEKHMNMNKNRLPREKVLKYFRNLVEQVGDMFPSKNEPGERRQNTQIGRQNHRRLELHMKQFKDYNGTDLIPGIELEHSFKNGRVHGRIDVIDHNNRIIIDHKFGTASMSQAQFDKYRKQYPDYEIYTLHPNRSYERQGPPHH